MDLAGITGTAVKTPGQGAVTLQAASLNKVNQRPKVSDVSVSTLAGVDQRLFLATSNHGSYSNIRLITNHSASIGSGVDDANFRGTDNVITNMEVRALGQRRGASSSAVAECPPTAPASLTPSSRAGDPWSRSGEARRT
jgi:hypothetical protein